MREILFRGKTRRGTWMKGFLFKKYEDCCTDICIGTEPIWANDYGDISGDYAMVIPETIGQYTGLTDKNGTKIFENGYMIIDNKTYKVIFDNAEYILVNIFNCDIITLKNNSIKGVFVDEI